MMFGEQIVNLLGRHRDVTMRPDAREWRCTCGDVIGSRPTGRMYVLQSPGQMLAQHQKLVLDAWLAERFREEWKVRIMRGEGYHVDLTTTLPNRLDAAAVAAEARLEWDDVRLVYRWVSTDWQEMRP